MITLKKKIAIFLFCLAALIAATYYLTISPGFNPAYFYDRAERLIDEGQYKEALRYLNKYSTQPTVNTKRREDLILIARAFQQNSEDLTLLESGELISDDFFCDYDFYYDDFCKIVERSAEYTKKREAVYQQIEHYAELYRSTYETEVNTYREEEAEACSEKAPYVGMKELYLDCTSLGEGYWREKQLYSPMRKVQVHSYGYFSGDTNHICYDVYVRDGRVSAVYDWVSYYAKKKAEEKKNNTYYNYSSSSSKSSLKSGKSNAYDVYDYDDPDDFAEEWAEEFRESDDLDDYDEGYEAALDYWDAHH